MVLSSDAKGSESTLASLREMMQRRGVDALVVPSEDPHNSEIPPNAFKRREFLTGFTGTAGTALVTAESALLWTDGRYFTQAEHELGPHWSLMRAGEDGVPELKEWLVSSMPASSSCVAIDPSVHSDRFASDLSSHLSENSSLSLSYLDSNLVDDVWSSDRPPLPCTTVRIHPPELAGEYVTSKIDRMVESMSNEGADALVASALDEVCWLFNIRASDVENTPLVLSYAMLRKNADSDGYKATLYTDSTRIPDDVMQHLHSSGVRVKAYDAIASDVHSVASQGCKVWADSSIVNAVITDAAERGAKAFADSAKNKAKRHGNKKQKLTDEESEATSDESFRVDKQTPIVAAKARKNDAEIRGMHEAHIREGVVMAHFWSWLESEVAEGSNHSEEDAASALEDIRHKQQGYIEPSFPSILGDGPNAAIIHHRASSERQIGSGSMVLLDAGGQYDCGTTDATRTVHFGQPTEHQKQCFTRVLKGHIAVDRMIFPDNTAGHAVDSHARYELWQAGLDYRHGTGHGVGACLCVHEGPQSISPRTHVQEPLVDGMIVSDEPGYYEEGSFGVRIENLVRVKEASTQFNFAGKTFNCFETLTKIPYQAKMMDKRLLTEIELHWIDDYHQKVWDDLSPRLESNSRAMQWLSEHTQPIRAQLAAA